MQKDYWENYYRVHRDSMQPSLFAEFVLENYVKIGNSLVELGCGNGRDSVFFAANGINVLAIDQCEREIQLLSESNTYPNLQFKTGDFTRLGDIGMFDYVYARFTMHSISEEDENRTINWAQSHLKKGGLFLVEARSTKNELYGVGIPVQGELNAYIHNNHFRRFIDTSVFRVKLLQRGFEPVFFEEKNGFGGSTNQLFFRKIAIKK